MIVGCNNRGGGGNFSWNPLSHCYTLHDMAGHKSIFRFGRSLGVPSFDLCGAIFFVGLFAGHLAGLSPARFSPAKNPARGTDRAVGCPGSRTGMLVQCVVVRCSVLQCVCVWQCVAACCSVLQCVAECGSVLQCVAVCGRVWQRVAVQQTEIHRDMRHSP